jgi:hypothetical protein
MQLEELKKDFEEKFTVKYPPFKQKFMNDIKYEKVWQWIASRFEARVKLPTVDTKFAEYFGWLKKFAEFTKDKENCFLIAHFDGSIEIYVNGDDWVAANDYETALKQYLRIVKEWEGK